CDVFLLTAAGAEHDVVHPLEIIRHLAAAVAHALLDDLFPVDLDEIGQEFVEFVGDGKEVTNGHDADHVLVLVNDRESPYLMLHHHTGSVCHRLLRTHRNEWRAHDFVHMYRARFAVLCHDFAGEVFLGHDADRLVVLEDDDAPDLFGAHGFCRFCSRRLDADHDRVLLHDLPDLDTGLKPDSIGCLFHESPP